MTSEADALAAVLAKVRPLPDREVFLLDSLGKFAARDLFARGRFPLSTTRRWMVTRCRRAPAEAGARLSVVGEQPAGADRRLTIGAGEAIRFLPARRCPAEPTP